VTTRLLYPLVFVAGAATMSTEMSASRLLAPFFGSSILIWANIIGLILIYLSAGYFLGGRLADRHPHLPYLARLMIFAAAAIAVTPFLAQPLLDLAVGAFADASVGAFLGSFFAAMLIFSVPITLLGMASPFAIRLGVVSVERAGEVAGRMYALSTAGSILGTFLPVAVLIPLIGTRRTMLATAAVLAVCAAPALGRRYVLVPAAIAALALLPPGLVKQGDGAIFFTGASASVKGYALSAPFAMGKFALRGLAQSMARELQPKGIHVAHFVIDGAIRNPGRTEPADAPDSMLDPDAIARTYLHVLQQDRSAWTWEVELRPWVERF